MKTHPKKNLLPLAALTALCLSLTPAGADDLPLAVMAKGVEIESGSLGKFVLEPPALVLEGGKSEKPVFEALSETEGVARYSGGGECKFRVADGEIHCEYSGLESGKALRFQMLVPIRLNQGGKFAFGPGDWKEFPVEHSGQFVGTAGGSEPFALVDAGGEGFSLQTKANWQALQDNRQFNWATFAYQFLYDLKANAEKSSFAITVAPSSAR